MGRRTNLRLDDTVASPRPRLRATHRRIRCHDPYRPRSPSHTAHRSLRPFSKRTLSDVEPNHLDHVTRPPGWWPKMISRSSVGRGKRGRPFHHDRMRRRLTLQTPCKPGPSAHETLPDPRYALPIRPGRLILSIGDTSSRDRRSI